MFSILTPYANTGIVRLFICPQAKRILLIGWIFCSIPLFAQLNANFSLSKDKGCSPLLVNFTNTSTGFPDSCFWSLGINGNTSDNCNPSAIYNEPGTYSVTLTVFKGGQQSIITKTVTVFKDPVAQFTANPTSGCVPLNVQLVNTSTLGDAPISSFLWDLGDGRTNSSQNPSTTYTSAGPFSVTLIITDANGCKNTITKPNLIQSNVPPTVSFTSLVNETCQLPFTAQFSSQVNPNTNVTYLWNFGNGNTSSQANPSVTYNSPGNYNVSLTVHDQNSCSSTVSVPNAIQINDFSINVALPNSVCQNISIHPTLTTLFQNVQFFWDLGNGTTSTDREPEIIYTQPGNYTIKCLAVTPDGCRDSVQLPIRVNDNAQAEFTSAMTASCSPFTLNLSNLSSNATSFQWTIYGPDGYFTTSSSQNPSIFLPNEGNYTVELRAYSSNGCVSYIKKENYATIQPNTLAPKADKFFGCIPLTVQFNAHPSIPASSYTWDFGDGITGVGENPTHLYTQEGVYAVKVTAIYPAPCGNTISIVDSIHVGKKAPFSGDFDLTTVCVHRETVTYQAHGGLPNTIFTWMFGDGEGQGAMATHVYQDPSDPEKYTVNLVADNSGCRDTLPIKEIFVAYPKAEFTAATVCGSTSVTFTNASRGFSTAIWDFGDGTTITTNNLSITHDYTSTNSVNVLLKVYNATTGCWDSIRKIIDFVTNVNINYTSQNTSGCAPLVAHFTLPYDTLVQSYTWNFGNGIRGFGRNIYGIFPTEGTYYVTLDLKLKNGCTVRSTKIDTVRVVDIHPDFSVQKSGSCLPATYTFTNTSTTSSSGFNSVKWEIDTTVILNGNIANHIFTQSGLHTIKMTVTNFEGCSKTITKTVTVGSVKADFTIDRDYVCSGINIHFNNTSTGNIVRYLWDFGDGTTSTEASPDHYFSEERYYTITLTITDTSGCDAFVTKTNYVHIKNIHVDFNASPRFKSCPDLISNFQLLNTPTSGIQSILWDFGNGNTSNNLNTTPQAVYTKADSFDVKLIVVDNNNCRDTLVKKDYIIVSGPSGEFTFNPDSGCVPLQVGFNAQFKNTTSTVWDFGNGDTRVDNSASENINYNYNREGDYTPAVILKDDYGCTVNVVSKKKVRIGRLFAQFHLNKNTLCLGSDQVILSDSAYTSSNTAILKRFWTVSDGNHVDTGVGNSFLPTSNKPLEFSYYVENTFGCSQSIQQHVQVFEYPVTIATEDKVICKGEKIPITINTNATHVNWSPSTGINNPNSNDVLASPTTSSTYVIKSYINQLCPVNDTVNIEVRKEVNAKAYPDTIICFGDTVQLHGIADNTSLNATKVFWTPATTLSSQSDFNPMAFPRTPTTYLATFTNGLCAAKQVPVFVDVKPLPTVTAGDEKIIIKGMSIDLTANSTNANTFNWFPDYNVTCTTCPTTKATPEMDTTYYVQVKNQYGCVATANQKVKVIEDCAGNMVFIPNTFTPNNDGQNDLLRVLGPGVASVKVFRIFNRWGQLVFETRDMNEGWDGTFNGKELNPGVFVYYIEVECIDFQTTMKKGDVTLLR